MPKDRGIALGFGVVVSCLLLGAVRVAAGAETSSVRVRIVDDKTGEPLPAMVCIRSLDDDTIRLPPDGQACRRVSQTADFYKGVEYRKSSDWVGPVRKMQGQGDNDDRSYVYEERPSIPYWREPVMFQTPAQFSIRLPAGRWRFSVARGMECVPVTWDVETGRRAPVEKEIRIERWIDLAAEGWYSGDVHVHHPTTHEAHRDYLLEYARAEDLHVVNVLEMGHHGGTDFKQAGFGAKFRVERDGYWLVSGQEEPRSTFGHIIGLNVDDFVRDVATYDVAFRGIHAQDGALVGFAHFAWNGCALPRGFPWYVTTGELDFVELLQFGLLNSEGYADYLNLGFRFTAAAGSDVPWGSTIGEVRTYVYTGKTLDMDRWFEGIEKGRTFVSNGPALELRVDGELPGSEVRLAGATEVRVAAKTRGHPKVGLPKTLVVAGPDGVIREVSRMGDSTSIGCEFRLPVSESIWLVARTVCDNGAVAHSSPVYVVVDGDPPWSPSRGPAIIDRQLEEIAAIEEEFRENRTTRGRGIRERLKAAQDFYRKLRTSLEESGARRARARGKSP